MNAMWSNQVSRSVINQSLILLATMALFGNAVNAQGPAQDSSVKKPTVEHADHKDEHGGKESGDHATRGEESEGGVRLTEAQIKLADIVSAPVQTGSIATELRLNGEVTLNQDRVAEIVPRVPGVVQEVRANLGHDVEANEVLAVIQSRELADSVADFLAARERLSLAQSRFEREETLFKKKISPEQEYLEVRQVLSEARITQRTAEQKLRALGISSEELQALTQRPNELLTRYSLTAPFAGTIIEKHLTQGEQVSESPLFRIAQLDNIWVIASVYPKDIASIAVGQPALITVQSYPSQSFSGTVTWVAAVIDQQTRTLPVRVELDNPGRLLKAGMFAQVSVAVASTEGALVIPLSAVQTQKGEAIVFVDKGNGEYERREIAIGAKSSAAVEILGGLQEGERVVTRGAFTLRSELEKSGFEAGHGH